LKSYIFAVIFLLAGGIFSVYAQDLIILKDGNIIEAKISEISSSEIKYSSFDHLDGPVYVVPAADVFSIRFENGRTEVINASPSAGGPNSRFFCRSATRRTNAPANYPEHPAPNPYSRK
jgi:hypothetical protein